MPAFEVNSKTIEMLSGLVDINNRKDEDTKILVEDVEQKRDEYRCEGM